MVLTHPDSFVWDLCTQGWFATPELRNVDALATKIELLLTTPPVRLSDNEKTLRALFEGYVAQQRDPDALLDPLLSEATHVIAKSVLCSYWPFAREKVIGAGGADPVGTAWPHLRSEDSEHTDDALNAVSLFSFPTKTSVATQVLHALARLLADSGSFDTSSKRYLNRVGSVSFEAALKKTLLAFGTELFAEVNTRLASVLPPGHRFRSELVGIDGLEPDEDERSPRDLNLFIRFTFDMGGASHEELVEMPVNIKACGVKTTSSNSGGAWVFQWVMFAEKANVPNVNKLIGKVGVALTEQHPIPDSNYLFWSFDKGEDSATVTTQVVPLLGAEPGQHLAYNPAQSFPNIQVIPEPATGQVSTPNSAYDARERLFTWYRAKYRASVQERLDALDTLVVPQERALLVPALPFSTS